LKKVIRSLPVRFNPNISTLEDRKYLDKLKMDELHGILTAYEMRIRQEKRSKREASFKSSNKTNRGK